MVQQSCQGNIGLGNPSFIGIFLGIQILGANVFAGLIHYIVCFYTLISVQLCLQMVYSNEGFTWKLFYNYAEMMKHVPILCPNFLHYPLILINHLPNIQNNYTYLIYSKQNNQKISGCQFFYCATLDFFLYMSISKFLQLKCLFITIYKADPSCRVTMALYDQ